MKWISLCRVDSIFILPCHHPVEGKKVYLNIKKNVQMEKLTFIFSSGFCIFPEIKFQSLLIPLSFKTDQKNPFNGIFPFCKQSWWKNNHSDLFLNNGCTLLNWRRSPIRKDDSSNIVLHAPAPLSCSCIRDFKKLFKWCWRTTLLFS